MLDTRVRVELGRRKGKITVEFASVDDLERIVGVIAPQLAVHRAAAEQTDQSTEIPQESPETDASAERAVGVDLGDRPAAAP